MHPRSLAAALAASLIFVLPAAANASDKGVQKTVVKAENTRLIPAAIEFEKSGKALAESSNPDVSDLLAKTGRFRNALEYSKNRLVPLHTETARYAAGKTAFLTALREYDLGLVQYIKLLKTASSTTPIDRDALRAKLTTFAKRIRAASKDEDAALQLLGIKPAS